MCYSNLQVESLQEENKQLRRSETGSLELQDLQDENSRLKSEVIYHWFFFNAWGEIGDLYKWILAG